MTTRVLKRSSFIDVAKGMIEISELNTKRNNIRRIIVEKEVAEGNNFDKITSHLSEVILYLQEHQRHHQTKSKKTYSTNDIKLLSTVEKALLKYQTALANIQGLKFKHLKSEIPL